MKKCVHLNETNLYELIGSILEKLDLGISSAKRKRMNENIVRGVKNGIMKYVKEAAEEGDDDELKRYRQELLGSTIFWEVDVSPFYIELESIKDVWRWESNDDFNGWICLCASNTSQCIAIPPQACDELINNGYIDPEDGEIIVLVRAGENLKQGMDLMNNLLLQKEKRAKMY